MKNMRTPAYTMLALTAIAASASCLAAEKFTFLTNWYARAEHGGFYQARAKGLYKNAGLDVEIKMGGPQINVMQLMAAGQADCTLGDNGGRWRLAGRRARRHRRHRFPAFADGIYHP